MRARFAGFGGAAVLAGALSLGGASCADEVVAPAPRGAGGAGSSSSSGVGGEGGSTPTPRRTVQQRKPFGNVAVRDNLLWDGDFEWLSAFSDQYGWLAGPSPQALGYGLPKQVVGAACRSGVKCIELKKGWLVVGVAVAAVGKPLEATVHAALDGDCAALEVALVGFGGDDPDVAMPSEGKVDGWCRFHAVASERKHAVALYLRNGSTGAIRVDDAVVRPVEASAAHEFAPTMADEPELRSLKRELVRRTRPAPRPRSDAERSFLGELERRRQR